MVTYVVLDYIQFTLGEPRNAFSFAPQGHLERSRFVPRLCISWNILEHCEPTMLTFVPGISGIFSGQSLKTHRNSSTVPSSESPRDPQGIPWHRGTGPSSILSLTIPSSLSSHRCGRICSIGCVFWPASWPNLEDRDGLGEFKAHISVRMVLNHCIDQFRSISEFGHGQPMTA